jgi:putative NADH dehydrogenase with NAD(P)-binding domain protein
MKAILLGATGAVGRDLVRQLLQDDRFTELYLLVRRIPEGLSSPKLRIQVLDFDQPDQWPEPPEADVLFSSLGTTLRDAGSQAAQYRVDYGYQYEVARRAAARGVPHYVLVSSWGAKPKARSFYSRMKGELEEAVQALPFRHISILRPPLLLRPGSTRSGERLATAVLRGLSTLGLLRAFRPMPTSVVARCMHALSTSQYSGILEPRDIWPYAD